VVWEQDDAVRDNIWSSRFAGGSWGTPSLIENVNTGDASSPQVAVDADGNALAVWEQMNNATNFSEIWSNQYAAGSWGTAVLVSVSTADAFYPKVAMDLHGSGMVAWQQWNGGVAYNWSSFSK
jgi:hypothetical protein